MWLGVLRHARDPFDSDCARKGTGLFNALLNVNAPGMAIARALRYAGASDEAASVVESVRDVSRPSHVCDIRAMFNRPCVAVGGFQ